MTDPDHGDFDHGAPLLLTPRHTIPSKASTLSTALNMLNELEGAGLLGMPYAVKLGGCYALPCLGIVGILSGFTGWALANCMYIVTKTGEKVRARDNYAAVGGAVYGGSGTRAVKLCQCVNLTSVGIVYLVLVASTMADLLPLSQHSSFLSDLPLSHIDTRLYACIATVLVIPTVHIGGYKKLSFMSLLGVMCLSAIFVVGVGCSAQVIADDGASSLPKLGDEHAALFSVPAAYSMFLFAFSAHGIFPDLESSMEKPEHFGKVVSGVFTVNVLVKVVFAMCGVFAFGTETDEIITSNLPGKWKGALGGLVVANTLLSFPLPLVPVFRMLKVKGGNDSNGAAEEYSEGVQWTQRTGVVLFCGMVAACLPSFSLAMGFMGSLTLPFLTFIFPALFYLKLHKPEGLVRAVCVLVIGCGGLGLVCGLASNVAIAAGWD